MEYLIGIYKAQISHLLWHLKNNITSIIEEEVIKQRINDFNEIIYNLELFDLKQKENMKTLENVVVLSLEDYEQLMKNQKPEELEVGKWYKSKMMLGLYQGNEKCYGFFDGSFGSNYKMTKDGGKYTKATPDEIHLALIDYAEKLGFEGKFKLDPKTLTELKCNGVVIFKDGIWEKPKPKIDYDRLKTGSVVKLKNSGNHCEGLTDFDLNKPATILLYKSNGFYYKGEYRQQGRTYTTFVQGQNTSHFTTYNEDYITEVISY